MSDVGGVEHRWGSFSKKDFIHCRARQSCLCEWLTLRWSGHGRGLPSTLTVSLPLAEKKGYTQS